MYSMHKNELVLSAKGNICGLRGDAELMTFLDEQSASNYITKHKHRFEKLYGSVQLRIQNYTSSIGLVSAAL